jgi:hypothetical protein
MRRFYGKERRRKQQSGSVKLSNNAGKLATLHSQDLDLVYNNNSSKISDGRSKQRLRRGSDTRSSLHPHRNNNKHSSITKTIMGQAVGTHGAHRPWATSGVEIVSRLS